MIRVDRLDRLMTEVVALRGALVTALALFISGGCFAQGHWIIGLLLLAGLPFAPQPSSDDKDTTP